MQATNVDNSMNYRRFNTAGYGPPAGDYGDNRGMRPEPAKRPTMVSSWTRIRMRYFGGLRTGTIVGVVVSLLLLCYVLSKVFTPSKPNIYVRHKTDPPITVNIPTADAVKFLNSMKDTRPEHCVSSASGIESRKDAVSVIMYYKNDAFYRLVFTLLSVIQHTDLDEVAEIIILDDGTINPTIKSHAEDFILEINRQFPRIKHFAADSSDGPASTRMKAVEVAEGDILVFLDVDVIVNRGWLKPLVERLPATSRTIAVPHFDTIQEPLRFFPLKESFGNIFGWSLTTYWYDTLQQPLKPFQTAVMRGDAFAMRRDFLRKIGSFDEAFGVHGGENLELSIRTWLCSGSIEVVPCSRVAVREALKPTRISNIKNIHRIAELWFGDHKRQIYRFTGVDSKLDEDEKHSIRERKANLAKTIQCKSIDTYLGSIADDIPKLGRHTQLLGKMRTTSGHCARATETDKLKLVPCLLHIFDRDMLFELLDNGHIRTDDRYLHGNDYSKEVALREVEEDSKYQKWDFSSSGLLRLRDTSYCLGFSRKKLSESPELVLEKCESESIATWNFVVV